MTAGFALKTSVLGKVCLLNKVRFDYSSLVFCWFFLFFFVCLFVFKLNLRAERKFVGSVRNTL